MKITNVFHQSSDPEVGIPSHWCVQYVKEAGSVEYEYFKTEEEAYTWIANSEKGVEYVR